MVTQQTSTRALVVRFLIATVIMIAGLKLTMPHQPLWREAVVAVVAMGGALGLMLRRRKRDSAGSQDA